MLLRDAVVVFLRGYFATRDRSERTKIAYQADLLQLIQWMGGDRDVKDVSPEDLEDWIASLKERYAPRSIRRKLATTRVFFKYLVKKGEIKQSPYWLVTVDIPVPRDLPSVLTEEESRRLVLHVRGEESDSLRGSSSRFLAVRDRAIVEVLLGTGVRVGELVGLRVKDCSLADNLLKIRGKGGRDRVSYLPGREPQAALRQYLDERLLRRSGHECLWLSTRGTPLGTQGVSLRLEGLGKRAGIEKKVTPHMLRHSAATLLLNAGMGIRSVQEVLGHSAISMTERYTQISKIDLIDGLESLHPLVKWASTVSRIQG